MSAHRCHSESCSGRQRATGCENCTRPSRTPSDYALDEVSRLLAYCERAGLVLTVEQVPLRPLAMGNHVSRASVRAARRKA
jgi:hypothetical protein